MKKVKDAFAKCRDKMIPAVSDFMVAHPNLSTCLLLANAVVVLIFLLG